MENSAPDEAGDQARDHWDRLDGFLETDPRDPGCDAAREKLDVYAELLAAGSDPTELLPGLHAHLLACETCAQDLNGLLAALTGRADYRSL